MIADALLKNNHMKLREFHGTRSRLEDEGLESLAQVFSKQGCLEKIDVSQNGSKRGLVALLNSLASCASTLTHLVIQDNKSINKAIPQLQNCISSCKNLRLLNISDLNMRKKHFVEVTDTIIETLKNGSGLKELIWNYDLAASNTCAKNFLQQLYEMETSTLRVVSLKGVFQSRENRENMRQLFEDREVTLQLFQPNFTDDESEDNDATENESAEGDDTTEEEQQ